MNVLSLLNSDLADVVIGITEGSLSVTNVIFDQKATVCKYIVPSST
jgi:phosphoribosylamine--glycine ligase